MFFWMVSITDLTQFEVVYCRWGHFPRLNKLMPMSVGKLSVRLSWTKKVLMTLQELCWLQIWTPQDTLTRQWKNLVWQLRHAPLIQINALIEPSRWWPSGKSLGPRGLLPLWSQVRALWLLIWWPLEAYMVVNFRARGISWGARKLARTPTLN
jgi:hypothetical protein